MSSLPIMKVSGDIEKRVLALQVGLALSLVLLAAVGWGQEKLAGPADRFRPGQPWPDTAGVQINAHGFCLLRHGERYYWYGSHKIAGKTESENNEAGVRCYSSRDLLHWENAGLVLSKTAPGMHADVAEAVILDRPKVIYLAGTSRFVLYFKLYPPKAGGGGMSTEVAFTGVAVATQPTGPFEYRGKFLGGGSTAGSGDFAIFQDADGAAYHICVRKPDQGRKDKPLVCGRLADDGLKPAGEYVAAAGRGECHGSAGVVPARGEDLPAGLRQQRLEAERGADVRGGSPRRALRSPRQSVPGREPAQSTRPGADLRRPKHVRAAGRRQGGCVDRHVRHLEPAGSHQRGLHLAAAGIRGGEAGDPVAGGVGAVDLQRQAIGAASSGRRKSLE